MNERRVCAPMASTVVAVMVAEGERVEAGQPLVIVEAMKMEHELRAEAPGQVLAVRTRSGESVEDGDVLLELADVPAEDRSIPAAPSTATATPTAGAPIRQDLQELRDRLAATTDAARPEAVARRRANGLRTARENIADLCDAGSFVEYGALAIAAQRSRRSLEDLIQRTPADGMVTGIGSINAGLLGEKAARSVVMAYDATVLAGTQGMRNHQKTDRMLGIALEQRLPTVLFAEGGGGRPGDTDAAVVAGLHVATFASFARLSGRVPVVGIVAGRCFAGNAALVGCSDVIIATRDSNIGMGGPAMVEGGGLGVWAPEDIGPSGVQATNGVIDVLVDDEAEAVDVARHYLSFFQGPLADWSATATRRAARRGAREPGACLRHARGDAPGGRPRRPAGTARRVSASASTPRWRASKAVPVGLMANNPRHLGGAIDADAADKAARFIQLCNAHGLPVVSASSTPRASWSARRSRRRPRCAMSAACSSQRRTCACPSSRWCCARAMAWARWR